jgi:hypothetical protein
MRLRELNEAATTSWGRKGTTVVRKYRCSAGPRKGRMVANPSTCTAPINITKSAKFKQTKKRLSQPFKIKSKRTKKYNPASRRLKKLNRSRKKI